MQTVFIRRRRSFQQIRAALMVLLMAIVAYTISEAHRSKVSTHSTLSQEIITQQYTLPAQSLSMVSFGTYNKEAEARVEAARYVGRGAAGYIYAADSLHVIAAGYAEYAQAERVAEKLKADEGLECCIVTCNAEGVSLEITATAQQLELLMSCDATLRQALASLQSVSFALDAADADYLVVQREIQNCINQTSYAATQLRASAQLSNEEIGSEYLRLLTQYASSLREILTEGAATTLYFSSRLKYALLENELAYINFLQSLSHAVF